MEVAVQVHRKNAPGPVCPLSGESDAQSFCRVPTGLPGVDGGDLRGDAPEKGAKKITPSCRSELFNTDAHNMNIPFHTRESARGHVRAASRKHLRCVFIAFVAIFLCFSNRANCGAQSATEYQVKAAY